MRRRKEGIDAEMVLVEGEVLVVIEGGSAKIIWSKHAHTT